MKIQIRYIKSSPLIKMTSKQATWNWIQEFEQMKKFISSETFLVYPNFSKPFVIHMDANKVQLEAVISQDFNLRAFYSSKLNIY